MRWLLFLSRVAFICNLFSVLALLIMLKNVISQPAIVSTVGIIGYMLAFVFNPLVNLLYGALSLAKRSSLAIIPKWLLLTNFVFFIIQRQGMIQKGIKAFKIASPRHHDSKNDGCKHPPFMFVVQDKHT